MRTAKKLTGEKYYEYILCYDNDLLCISQDPKNRMNDIQSILKFKNYQVETPDFYLGERLKKKYLGWKEV